MSDTAITKPMPSIGVDMYHFAKVSTDVRGEKTTYETPIALPGTVEIAPTDSGNVSTFDADNGVYTSTPYIEKMGHDITNADIPPGIDAIWRGLALKDGGVEVNGTVDTPKFAVMWRILKSDGSYRYVRYYKGVYSFASNVGGKTKPSSGSVDHQTAKATFTAEQRMSDGKSYYYVDDNNLPEGVSKETIAEKWFTDPNWYPSDALNTEAESGDEAEAGA